MTALAQGATISAPRVHQCPVAGCWVTDVPDDKLMCLVHWRRVPSFYRIEVTRLWRLFQKSGGRGYRVRLMALKNYTKARGEAIVAVQR